MYVYMHIQILTTIHILLRLFHDAEPGLASAQLCRAWAPRRGCSGSLAVLSVARKTMDTLLYPTILYEWYCTIIIYV